MAEAVWSPGLEATDVGACAVCGYDVGGLDGEDACPECGASVADSRDGRLIATAPEGYAHRLAGGAALAEVGAAGMVLVGLLQSIAMGARDWLGAATTSEEMMAAMAGRLWTQMVFMALAMAMMAAAAVGWWRVSSEDPRFAVRDRAAGWRLALRVSLVAVLGAQALLLAGMLVTTLTLAGEATPDAMMRYVPLTAAAAFTIPVAQLARFVATLVYVRVLSRRLGDDRLFAMATRLFWVVPLLVGANWAAEWGIGRALEGRSGFFWADGGREVVAAVVWMVVWVGMIDRLRRGLGEAAATRATPNLGAAG